MQAQISFSGKGDLGRHKAEQFLPNTGKSQVLLDEGFRFCLSTHALCFQTPISQRSTFFLKLEQPSPLQFITFRVLVHPRVWLGGKFLLSYQRWSLFFGVLQISPAWFGCLRGQQVRVRRVSAQTSFQNQGLNVIYIELLEQNLGAALCARRSCIPQLFFYECSSLSWPNTWVFCDLIIKDI